MNKSDISEIRGLFSKEECTIDRFVACYVTSEKEKLYVTGETFLTLPDAEYFRYIDIFKKSLSGSLGKNLHNMDFPLEEEMGEGKQKFLLALRDSGLKDEDLVHRFFDLIIENYQTIERYYIILAHAAYDIPTKAKDGILMEDMSENVYEYILSAICPVKLSKPSLGYNEEEERIGERIRDWVVEPPAKAFLFPTFEDRTANIHNILYYTKKAEDLSEDFIDAVFGTKKPLSAKTQKEVFNTIVADAAGEEISFQIAQNIHENIKEIIQLNEENPEPLVLDAPDMKRLLEKSGVEAEKLSNFEETFQSVAGENRVLMVSNLEGVKKFAISTDEIEIKASPEAAALITEEIIDGRPCLVIPITDSVKVNGLYVH